MGSEESGRSKVMTRILEQIEIERNLTEFSKTEILPHSLFAANKTFDLNRTRGLKILNAYDNQHEFDEQSIKKVRNGFEKSSDLLGFQVLGRSKLAKEMEETVHMPTKFYYPRAIHRNEQTNEFEGYPEPELADNNKKSSVRLSNRSSMRSILDSPMSMADEANLSRRNSKRRINLEPVRIDVQKLAASEEVYAQDFDRRLIYH